VKKAAGYFGQAAAEGYAAAQYELALCYRHGRGGVDIVDLGAAFRLFERAAGPRRGSAEPRQVPWSGRGSAAKCGFTTSRKALDHSCHTGDTN